LQEVIADFVGKKSLNQERKNEIIDLANEYLHAWLAKYTSEVGMRKTKNEYAIEVDFETGIDELPKIKLTGKLDKIELLDDGGVIVTDYKTGKPAGQKAIREGAKYDYFRQLIFYKLMLDIDGKYNMQKGVIDFVQPKNKEGQMVRESFEISQTDLDKLKEEIKSAVEQIYNLDFWDTRCEAHQKDPVRGCEYCRLRDLMK